MHGLLLCLPTCAAANSGSSCLLGGLSAQKRAFLGQTGLMGAPVLRAAVRCSAAVVKGGGVTTKVLTYLVLACRA